MTLPFTSELSSPSYRPSCSRTLEKLCRSPDVQLIWVYKTCARQCMRGTQSAGEGRIIGDDKLQAVSSADIALAADTAQYGFALTRLASTPDLCLRYGTWRIDETSALRFPGSIERERGFLQDPQDTRWSQQWVYTAHEGHDPCNMRSCLTGSTCPAIEPCIHARYTLATFALTTFTLTTFTLTTFTLTALAGSHATNCCTASSGSGREYLTCSVTPTGGHKINVRARDAVVGNVQVHICGSHCNCLRVYCRI